MGNPGAVGKGARGCTYPERNFGNTAIVFGNTAIVFGNTAIVFGNIAIVFGNTAIVFGNIATHFRNFATSPLKASGASPDQAVKKHFPSSLLAVTSPMLNFS